MKRGKGIVTILVVLICVGLLGWYATSVISDTSKKQDALAAGKTSTEAVESTTEAVSGDSKETKKKAEGIKLGLDLSGGVSITYQIMDKNPTQTDIDDTIAKLEERASSYTNEYSVYQVGTDRITVEIPGVYDADEVLEKLGSPGSLYFIRHKDSEGNENYTVDQNVGDYVLTKPIEELEGTDAIIFTGDAVKNATAEYQTSKGGAETKEPVVNLQLKDDAAELWYNATEEAYNNGQDSIGIYYDDHFISVPAVRNGAIGGGSCVIEGQKDFEECEELATFIRVGAMKLELKKLTASVVGAQLGGKALSTSVKAAIIGIILVMIFMIIMYGISGLAADIALAIYTTLVVLSIYWFEITLTLPGIAGIILGIGMAVDANVITFARIREEIATGKGVLASIKEGYQKAFSAILDGNITTFIAAVVLMILGSGTVKGFSYTLMISIILSMFSALVIARLVMLAFFGVGLKDEKFYGRAKERQVIDFMKHKAIYFGISIAVILAGVVGMIGFAASGNGNLNYGLEFVGGTSTTVDMGKSYTVEELESSVKPAVAEVLGISESAIQVSPNTTDTKVTFKTPELSEEQHAALNDTLETKFSVDTSKTEYEDISSTISGEMRKNAIIAVIVACICMLLYIWFRFKDIRFASSAIFALVHDVLVVLTAYALIRISVGNTFIACMLTIVGYSVNDTIVIFDRIRENMHGSRVRSREDLAAIANKSLTQTLARSINTSITTVIMVLLLFILGVASIREFALPMLVGMICGSYSSIFIATELWYVMKVHLSKNKLVKADAKKKANI